jgi:nucleotide-binding universal stress UspA family protein
MITFSQYLKGLQNWHCSNLFNWFIESLKYIRITNIHINVLKNRFKNILVALDGSISSTRGMNEAISLARQCNGSITGIYVLPAFPSEPTISLSYRQYLVRVSKEFMSNAKTAAARHGIEFEEKIVTSNDIVNAISAFAKSDRSDVIVIGARGRSSPKSTFLGSVSNGILNSCSMPVLVVR